jgi:hypothetical protein
LALAPTFFFGLFSYLLLWFRSLFRGHLNLLVEIMLEAFVDLFIIISNISQQEISIKLNFLKKIKKIEPPFKIYPSRL